MVSQFGILTTRFSVTGVKTGTMQTVRKSQNLHMMLWCCTRFLSWLCPECRKAVKNPEGKRLVSLESEVSELDKSMKDHLKRITQSLKEQETAVDNQTRLLERSVKELHNQRSSYADMVKGTCSDVVEKVSAKISSIPQGPSPQAEPKSLASPKSLMTFLTRTSGRTIWLFITFPRLTGDLAKKDQVLTSDSSR